MVLVGSFLQKLQLINLNPNTLLIVLLRSTSSGGKEHSC